MIVKAYPVINNTAGMLQCFEAVTVRALLFNNSDDTRHPATLLRTVRCDEFLTQAATTNQCCVATADEHQPIIGSEQERLRGTCQPLTWKMSCSVFLLKPSKPATVRDDDSSSHRLDRFCAHCIQFRRSFDLKGEATCIKNVRYPVKYRNHTCD